MRQVLRAVTGKTQRDKMGREVGREREGEHM